MVACKVGIVSSRGIQLQYEGSLVEKIIGIRAFGNSYNFGSKQKDGVARPISDIYFLLQKKDGITVP